MTDLNSRSGLLDRPVPAWMRVVLILVCALVPTVFVAREYEKRPDLTTLLLCGELFAARELPEVRAMQPALVPGPGYDGQFYAQMALDPTLRRPGMSAAMDDAGFRGQRIFLPALAHVLGLGRPRTVVFAYALLNLAFWYSLLALLVWRLPAASARSFLILFAMMWSTGTLISMEYALTDLPAATLGLISLGLGEASGALLISLAILTKPTCGLFILRYATPLPRLAGEWVRRGGLVLLALTLPCLWQFYLWHILEAKVWNESEFGFPGAGWWHRLVLSWDALGQSPWPRAGAFTDWGWRLFKLAAPLSMATQAAFLLWRPRWREPLWLVGAAFGVLFFCLSDKVFVDEDSYTRTVLPMAMAFNLLLMEVRSARAFWVWFVAGNVGLLEGLCEMVLRSGGWQ